MTARGGSSAHATNDLLRRYATNPAGNRVADREQYPALPPVWRDNRIGEDVQYFYHHDAHGRLAEKDERRIRDGGSHSHHYHYDNQHRLAHYRCEQQGVTLLGKPLPVRPAGPPASENGCGKADVSAEASAERNIFT
ncbi:core protein [Salmonella bongori]|nr:core protein [Salmonella bongori]